MHFKIFIQCNKFQTVAAEIARHTFIHFAGFRPDDIVIMNSDEIPALKKHNGEYLLRNGKLTRYSSDDCQSFTLSRFYVPELMNFKGKAIVVDPDVFFLKGKEELESFDFHDKAIYARTKVDPAGRISPATSVMFLDCDKLSNWKYEELMRKLFSHELDYYDLMWLKFEGESRIGKLSDSWNDIDHLDESTRMIHYSERITQPWMKGVRFDRYLPKYSSRKLSEKIVCHCYVQNPFPDQEKLFFNIAREAIRINPKIKDDIQDKLDRGLIRRDIFECLA